MCVCVCLLSVTRFQGLMCDVGTAKGLTVVIQYVLMLTPYRIVGIRRTVRTCIPACPVGIALVFAQRPPPPLDTFADTSNLIVDHTFRMFRIAYQTMVDQPPVRCLDHLILCPTNT